MKFRLCLLVLAFLGLGLISYGRAPGTAAQGPARTAPVTRQAVHADVSPALRSIPIETRAAPQGGAAIEMPLGRLPKTAHAPRSGASGDPVLQSRRGPLSIPGTLANFEGLANFDNSSSSIPPDPNGAVGPNHYVQVVNTVFAVYDKAGNRLYGPANNNTLWAGFGGVCETTNQGDPVVLYDSMADRWLMSQLGFNGGSGAISAPFLECIAISTTGDPTKTWNRYAFDWGSKFNDYPKLGVWPDGYYMTANQFNEPADTWAGAGVAVFERAKMLTGDPTARMIYFDLYTVNPNFGGMLPADLNGWTLPAAGTPAPFFEVDDTTFFTPNLPNDQLRVWEFHADWSTPANSTFGVTGNPNATLDVANFDPMPCLALQTRQCIPQPSATPSQYLDAIGDRVMHRAAYRILGGTPTVALNHTVDVSGGVSTGRAGVRWYQLTKTGGTWSIAQQSTFAPNDTENRWLGSIAMDRLGNMALGYSVSSTAVFPSIRYTGRLAADTPNTLSLGEGTIVAGTGFQGSSTNRWGDYSALVLDPQDDCTFWYTNEYYPASSSTGWHTRIGSFQLLPGCVHTRLLPALLNQAAP